jgi:hypothetical protein
MSDWQLKTPVAFFIFNRPETTARVFAEIARAKPPILLVVADGPRADVPGEIERCQAARAIVEQGVDWPCEVLADYADSNLGCKNRVSSGLDCVFESVEQAIILEDDCLPHPTFFRFCEDLLDRYRDDERIMTISGNNFQLGRRRTEYSYYFSRFFHCWGWASWRRAWRHYDVDMNLWPQVRKGGWLTDILVDSPAVKYWTDVFQAAYEGRISSWDYSAVFAQWLRNALTITPNVNLVSNIGFGSDATHTKDSSPLANVPASAVTFPLYHPRSMIRDAQADSFVQREFFSESGFLSRVADKTARLVSILRNCESGPDSDS